MTHSRRKSGRGKLLDFGCLILKDKGRRYHTLISAILGPSSGVHFSLECFVIGLLARAFAAWRPRGDVKRGTKKKLDDDDQPFFYMFAAGRFAAKYVKDTDDEESDSQDEQVDVIDLKRILRGWLHTSTPFSWKVSRELRSRNYGDSALN